jgi:hypothetical protein
VPIGSSDRINIGVLVERASGAGREAGFDDSTWATLGNPFWISAFKSKKLISGSDDPGQDFQGGACSFVIRRFASALLRTPLTADVTHERPGTSPYLRIHRLDSER